MRQITDPNEASRLTSSLVKRLSNGEITPEYANELLKLRLGEDFLQDIDNQASTPFDWDLPDKI